jgi:hypothetical protein
MTPPHLHRTVGEFVTVRIRHTKFLGTVEQVLKSGDYTVRLEFIGVRLSYGGKSWERLDGLERITARQVDGSDVLVWIPAPIARRRKRVA